MKIEVLLAIQRQLEAQVKGAPSQACSVSVGVDEQPCLGWLYANAQLAPSWWKSRDNMQCRAGLGIADLCSGQAVNPISALTSAMAQKKPFFTYVGGVEFPTTKPRPSEWAVFGSYRFVLPLFEWISTPEHNFFVCNWVPRSSISVHDQLQITIAQLLALQMPKASLPLFPRVSERYDVPSRSEWGAQLEGVLAVLSNRGPLNKVVLARETQLIFEEKINPIMFLDALSKGGGSPLVYEFLVQPQQGVCFVGRSPERLYIRDKNRLCTEALAGTRPSGDFPDSLYRSSLYEEHRWVSDMVEIALAGLSEGDFYAAPIDVVSIPGHLHHLRQTFEATLKAGVGDFEILKALYPTPAVSGFPVPNALAYLDQNEPFYRGWYSGLVGTWSGDYVEFCVAIRSALVTPLVLHVYAGAGIILSANVEQEWEELELKIRPFMQKVSRC